MHKRKTFFNLIFIFFCHTIVFSQNVKVDAYHYQTKKNIECKNGAVVSAHTLASEVGVQILKEGGNAIDAAIATQLALAVVYPGTGNIGGGGFMVAHLTTGQTIYIEYGETEPEGCSSDMYLCVS